MKYAPPPGPRSLPVIGNLHEFLREPLEYLAGLVRSYGDVVTFKLGLQPAVLINDPAVVDKLIRDTRFERSDSARRSVAALTGAGLLTLEGAQHRRHRRLISPALHRDRIKRYVAIMAEETYRVLDAWPSGEERDLSMVVRQLTLDIVARSLFNTEQASQASLIDATFKRLRGRLLRSSMMARMLPFRVPLLIGRPARDARALQGFIAQLVRERRAQRDDPDDLLTMLLAARDEDGGALSDEEIGAECLTMLLAGHATAAQTLTWAWHLLTQNPDVQAALSEEVRRELGDRPITFDDLARLPLTERVVRETLRLYPATWFHDRACAQPAELAGYYIPAGTVVAFSNWLLHRDPRSFAEPERFDPDRFLPERAAAIRDGSYLPFGAGVHSCIGTSFALAELRVILAAMAQRFQVRAVPRFPVEARPGITLAMRHPFAVVATLRRAEPAARVSAPARSPG